MHLSTLNRFPSANCSETARNIMAQSILMLLAILGLVGAQSISHSSRNGRPTCTVHPGKTNATDDVPTILKAFKNCNNGGNIVFPAGNTYHINSRLNPVLNDVTIDWHGEWEFSQDLDYWRNNSYHVAFQNHAAGFVITGDRIRIDGFGTGGINGK